MTERYLGSIISPNPVEPSEGFADSAASGVWNIHDPLIFGQAGDWPDPTNVPSVGLFMAGYVGSAAIATVDKIVPESAGNATDFGDTSNNTYDGAGFGSDTRSIVAGGYGSSAALNVIEYFTFASAGNATDFGDSTGAELAPPVSNSTRGVFGALTSSSNVMEYITIASAGNTTDFGDDDAIQNTGGSASNSHGGLS